MQNQLQSLSSLFSERLFRIPDYQRGYAWGTKELEEFWGDLLNVSEDHSHYTGVITLEDVSQDLYEKWQNDDWIINSKRFRPYYVVDGQQRLTTCIILIQAILEKIGDKELNFTAPEDIRRKFVFDTKGKSSVLRTYLFGYEKDNPSYEFLKRHVFQDFSEDHQPEQETIYTANLENAKGFFEKQLKNRHLDEVERIYTILTQRLLFNVYAISSEVDVYIAFETMNNRGKPLSHLELLKNRLIYLSTKINSDIEERRKLRHKINEAWKAVYHYLGANKENPLSDDEFLYNHYTLYFESDGSKHYVRYGNVYDLNAHYKDYILTEKFGENYIKSIDATPDVSLQFISSYVDSLKRSVETWFKIMNPEKSNFSADEIHVLKQIHRQSWSVPQSSYRGIFLLILSVYLNTRSVILRTQLLISLERMGFILELLRPSFGYAAAPLNLLKMATDLYRSNDNHAKKDAQIGIIRNNIEKWIAENVTPSFLNEFSKRSFRENGNFYSWTILKYILFEYEEDLRQKSKNSTTKINDIQFFYHPNLQDDRDYHTIEHIYPQNPGRSLCWSDNYSALSQQQKKLLRHSLGNLLALSKPKNSSLGNKCFAQKKGDIDSNVGYRYGSYSEIEVSSKDDWKPTDILERGLRILDFIERRWSLKIGTRREKIGFLGLEFVDKL